jgi:hypothetical protein
VLAHRTSAQTRTWRNSPGPSFRISVNISFSRSVLRISLVQSSQSSRISVSPAVPMFNVFPTIANGRTKIGNLWISDREGLKCSGIFCSRYAFSEPRFLKISAMILLKALDRWILQEGSETLTFISLSRPFGWIANVRSSPLSKTSHKRRKRKALNRIRLNLGDLPMWPIQLRFFQRERIAVSPTSTFWMACLAAVPGDYLEAKREACDWLETVYTSSLFYDAKLIWTQKSDLRAYLSLSRSSGLHFSDSIVRADSRRLSPNATRDLG